MKALPMRSWESIMVQASIAGLPRITRLNMARIPEHLSYADILIMQQENISLDCTQHNDKTVHVAGVWRSQELSIEDNQAT